MAKNPKFLTVSRREKMVQAAFIVQLVSIMARHIVAGFKEAMEEGEKWAASMFGSGSLDETPTLEGSQNE